MNSPEFNPELTRQGRSRYAGSMAESGNQEAGPQRTPAAERLEKENAVLREELEAAKKGSKEEAAKEAPKKEENEGDDTISDLEKAREQAAKFRAKTDPELENIKTPRDSLDYALNQLKNVDRDGVNPADRALKIKNAVDRVISLTRFARNVLAKDPTFSTKQAEEFLQMANALEVAIAPGSGQNLEAARQMALGFGDELKAQYNLKELRDPQKDYYTTPKNLQDLVERIIDVVSDEYALGGEYALLTKNEKTGELEVNPDNLTAWIRHRVWFFHDLNSTSNINLLENISLPTAIRPYALIELYGTDSYWQKKKTQIVRELSSSEWKEMIVVDSTGRPETNASGEVRIHIPNSDPEDPTPPRTFFTSQIRVNVDEKGQLIGAAEVKEQGAEPDKTYGRLRDDLLYEAYLPDFTHNSAISYRNAMGSEDGLSETLGKIYTKPNTLTKDRSRMFKILALGSSDGVTHQRHGTSEIRNQIENADYRSQGTLGKTIQRLINAYDYAAESVMPAKVDVEVEGHHGETAIEKQENLFREALGDKGAEEFYRAAIRVTIETKFPTGRYGDATCTVARELAKELDKELVQQDIPETGGNILRSRKDWEKVDFLDLMLLQQDQLLAKLAAISISREQYERALQRLKDKYAQFPAQLAELELSYKQQRSEQQLREQFVKRFRETSYFSGAWAKNAKFFDYFVTERDDKGKNYDMTQFAVDFSHYIWNVEDNYILNPFSAPKSIGGKTDFIRKALWAAMVKQMQISEREAKYADMYAFDLAYLFGSAAKNDVDGIGFDAWSKLQNIGRYREGQTEGKNAYGNINTIPGIRKLSFTFYEGMKIQREGEPGLSTNFREILQGGKGHHMNLNKDIDPFDFYENSMSQFYGDHLGNAFKVFKILNNIEIDFDKWVSPDHLTGGYTVDYQAFQKFKDDFWKPIRYLLDLQSPPYEAEFRSWTYHDEVQLRGKVGRKPVATTKSLRDLMFSELVKEMNMYGFEIETSGKNSREEALKATGMARNVLAYIIAKQIQLHRQWPGEMKGGIFKHYGLEDIERIKIFFSGMTRAAAFKGEDVEVLRDFFSPDEWHEILHVGIFANSNKLIQRILWLNNPHWRLYAGEYGGDMSGLGLDIIRSMFGGFFQLLFSGIPFGGG